MRRLALTILFLLFTHPAWAEWEKYDESPLATFYYDPTTIKRHENMMRVWVYTNLRTRMDGQWSTRALYEFDCKKERKRTLQQTSFSGPMMSGEIDSKNSFADAREWKDISSGSPRESLQGIVCGASPNPSLNPTGR